MSVPDRLLAERLAASLGTFRALVHEADGGFEVRVFPDAEAAARLVDLFESIGRWMDETDTASTAVSFDDRRFTLLRSPGGGGDPTQFLIERTIQLQTALDSRVAIEQAKGALVREHGLEPDDAFRLLRQTARSQRRTIRDLAVDVVTAAARGESAPVADGR